MDGVEEFLSDVQKRGLAKGKFLGLLNVLIGRRVARRDGTVLSTGVTWRALAAALKKLRWDTDAVLELGIDPTTLPPRDRQRFWYSAITQASVATVEATKAGDQFAATVSSDYDIGPAPGHSPGRHSR